MTTKLLMDDGKSGGISLKGGQPFTDGVFRQLRNAVQMKLILNSMTEGFNGLHTDIQVMSDFLNRFTLSQPLEDVPFAGVRTENAERSSREAIWT